MNTILIKLFTLTLLYALTFNLTSALAMQDNFFDNRLGQIIKNHSLEMPLPHFKTTNEALNFARAFSIGEVDFWQDRMVTFRAENLELNIILNIVERAVSNLPKSASPLAKITSKHKALTDIFSSTNCKAEYKRLYDLYKSYSEAVDYYQAVGEILTQLEAKQNIDIIAAIERISLFINEKKEWFTIEKKLRTTSCVKSINDQLKGQLDYYSCDLDKLVTTSQNTLIHILKSSIAKAIPEPEKETFALTTVSPKKKNKSKVKKKVKKNKRYPTIALHAQPSTPLLPALALAIIDQETTTESTVANVDLGSPQLTQPVVCELEPVATAISLPSLNIEEELEEKAEERLEEYMDQPWTTYPKIKKQLNNPKIILAESSSTVSTHATVSACEKETLLAFFSTEQQYFNTNVSMKEFVDLIASQFEGYVYRVGENLHFMAKDGRLNKWHSVCMHVLHKDKCQNIPRNTPYWKRAKTLLENLDAPNLLKG